MRSITILGVQATNFKNHENLDLVFGTLNTIKGMNGEGKSSIGEIYSWVLGGVDMMGWSKFDPTPTDRAVDKVFAAVLLKVDEKHVIFARELKKGKAIYYINESVKTATEFNAVVMSIFGGSKIGEAMDIALSLYNPSYFPSMPWADQRKMIMQHMTPPAMKEVLKVLPKLQADKLKEAFKKKTAAEIEKDNKLNKTNKEKELIAAKATLQTLEGQLKGVAVEDLAKLEEEVKKLVVELIAEETKNADYLKYRSTITTKQSTANQLYANIEDIKRKNLELKEQVDCPACNQKLSDETKQNVKDGLTAEYKPLVAAYKTLLAEIEEIKPVEDWNLERVKEIEVRRGVLVSSIQAEKNRLKAVEVIEAARKKVDEVQASLNDSIFLVDAIKAYNAKEAEIQAEDVKQLFKTLSIRLWNTPKDGDKTPAFEIEMNGKPYSKLSLGERAVAGLELIDVLTEQTQIITPVFIDNAESITSAVPVRHQSIAAYAMAPIINKDGKVLYNGTLTVETNIKNDSIIVDCEVV